MNSPPIQIAGTDIRPTTLAILARSPFLSLTLVSLTTAKGASVASRIAFALTQNSQVGKLNISTFSVAIMFSSLARVAARS